MKGCAPHKYCLRLCQSVLLNNRHWFSSGDIKTNKNYFITTPIFYVNSSPHIGHLYTALLADAAQRFQQLLNHKNVLFMTGTDEHGTKIQQAASKSKSAPQTYCDLISKQYKDLFHQFDIDYTHFVRTSDKNHTNAVQSFWNQLQRGGHVYSSQYAGWYCVADEAFVPDSQVTEIVSPDGTKTKVSAESGRPVEWTEETNYKFKLSSFQDDLLHWLKDESVVRPARFHAQLLHWVQDGAALQDVSISRPATRVHWGVPVPGDSEQTVYVWLDALVSYLTAAGYPNTSLWPPNCQTLGKDILKFHGVYWPAFLMAAGLEPPRSLVVHSHWTVNEEKMSKSLGNVIDPAQMAQVYTTEGLRYFLLREATLHSDANFSTEKIFRLLNAELADTLGNLLSRSSGKVINAGQLFPAFEPEHFNKYCQSEAAKLIQSLEDLPDVVGEHYSSFNYYRGVDAIMSVLHEANRFFDVKQPWNLRKDVSSHDHLQCVLHITLETLRVCGIALQPIIPQIARSLLDKLNIPHDERTWNHMKTSPKRQSTSLASDNIVLYRRILANN